MSDLSTPEEIRAEAADRIARAIFNAGVAPEFRGSWETVSEATRRSVLREATWYVDALGDLLPTVMEGRYIGRGLLRRTRYVTDWREPEETE